MIGKIRRRFILVCTVSVLFVVALVFCIILVLNLTSLNKNMDVLADRVYEGGGRFPNTFEDNFMFDKMPPKYDQEFDFITPETPFSTRHFTVLFDGFGNPISIFTESIYSINQTQAIEYAESVLQNNDERGWVSNYRYKKFSTNFGEGVVFVDGSVNRSAMMQSTAIVGIVLFICSALVLVLIVFLSNKAVKPIAESYEKQKQFVTDANHELKTPLTLILANLDIAESELGQNEWLDDIRSEGYRMTELVNQLVALSRMDEESYQLNYSNMQLSKMLSDMVSEFAPLCDNRGKTIVSNIEAGINYRGDEALIIRLICILLDNAAKYCDSNGEIYVSLHRGRHIVLTFENTYETVSDVELGRLFDRFYRADKARTFKGGYGIGLSIAKAIVEHHRGIIEAYKKDQRHIGFKITLD